MTIPLIGSLISVLEWGGIKMFSLRSGKHQHLGWDLYLKISNGGLQWQTHPEDQNEEDNEEFFKGKMREKLQENKENLGNILILPTQ